MNKKKLSIICGLVGIIFSGGLSNHLIGESIELFIIWFLGALFTFSMWLLFNNKQVD